MSAIHNSQSQTANSVQPCEQVASSSKAKVQEPKEHIGANSMDVTASLSKEWYSAFNIDANEYRGFILRDAMPISKLRSLKDKVAFYRSHFQVGLRLPLDPFICEYLHITNCAPIDLALNTIRILVSFIVICRLLGFEPTIDAFRYYYTSNMNRGHMVARAKPSALKLLTTLPNNVSGWDDAIILVESKKGWPFFPPCGAQINLSSLDEPSIVGFDKLQQAIYQRLVATGCKQKKVFVWKELTLNKRYLTLAGISRSVWNGAIPRVTFAQEDSAFGWRVHNPPLFPSDCVKCQDEDTVCLTSNLNGMVTAAELKEKKMAVAQAKKKEAFKRQLELQALKPEHLPLSENVPTRRSLGRPRRQLGDNDVSLQNEDVHGEVSLKIENQTAAIGSSETFVADPKTNIVSLEQRVHLGEKRVSCDTGKVQCRNVRSKLANKEISAIGRDKNVVNADVKDASWLKKHFIYPNTVEEGESLAAEIGKVPMLQNLDLFCQKGPGLIVGGGIMHRLIDFGLQEKLEDMQISSNDIFNRCGLIASEYATYISLLQNRIAFMEDFKGCESEGFKRVSQLYKQQDEIILQKTSYISQLELQVQDLKKELKKISNIEESYLTRITELEKTNMHLLAEQSKWNEDRISWSAEKSNLLWHINESNAASNEQAIKAFTESKEFKKIIEEKLLPYYEQGTFHGLRMAAGSNIEGITVNVLAEWAASLPYCEQARHGHMMVPYSNEELAEIATKDAENNRPTWNYPAPPSINVKSLWKAMTEVPGNPFLGDALLTAVAGEQGNRN